MKNSSYAKSMKLFAITAVFVLVSASCGQNSNTATKSTNDTIADVEIVSETDLAELPEVASKVEFSSMIIDSGDGPEICLGGVNESLPPQCSGPVAEGLQMVDWAETVSGVSFGERTVVVSWPPIDNKVTFLSDREYEQRNTIRQNNFPLPKECENLDWEKTVDIEVLSNWADANPEIAKIAYFSRDIDALQTLSSEAKDELKTDVEKALAAESELANQLGIGVLQVIEGKGEEVRKELTADGKTPCVVEVEHSMQDLENLRDQLDSQELYKTVYLTGSSIGGVSNKFEVSVAVADLSTVRKISESIDNNSALKVSGTAKILE